jgi:hypothetical protein
MHINCHLLLLQLTFCRLVELIVLNVGLQANILDTRTFSMFVVHAIILTFMTTPLTLLFYPPQYHVHIGSNKAKDGALDDETGKRQHDDEHTKTKFAMVLDKIDQLPAVMTITQLILPSSVSPTTSSNSSTKSEKASDTVDFPAPNNGLVPRIRMDALRLIELTARTSAVLKSQEAESLMRSDPVISVFRTFGYLNRFFVSTALSVVSYDQFSTAVADHARESESDMVIVPWCRAARSPEQGSSGSDVALFVDRGVMTSPSYNGVAEQHLFLPFFGGPDDRLALSFVVQLCSNPTVTATIVRLTKTNNLTPMSTIEQEKSAPVSPHNVGSVFPLWGCWDQVLTVVVFRLR